MSQRRYHGGRECIIVKHQQTEPVTIDSLIADLATKDGMTRVKARCILVSIGDDSVKPLINALATRNQLMRWEAAKALSLIGSPAATDALVAALEDKMFDVRWLAAQGLINIGREAIVPVLQAARERADSIWMREGAHHVLHDLARGEFHDVLRPVLVALEDMDAPVRVPLEARKAIEALRDQQMKPGR